VKEIRVLLADDRALVRGGIRALLEKSPELQIVAEASDGPEALRLIEQHQPDVALIESTISKLDGFEVTARLSKECPTVHVIVLSTHANEECLRQTMECGAAGYLTMTASVAELKVAIETVANGKTHIAALDSFLKANRIRTFVFVHYA
jgi:DNA-binding NarL/FixJ family response regulator